jgi:hypothetical protein
MKDKQGRGRGTEREATSWTIMIRRMVNGNGKETRQSE